MTEELALTFAVIYPTLDRPEMLLHSLRALLSGTVLPDEIIVVDQGRTTATRDALAELDHPLVRHVPSTERGLSRSRNTGIWASKGDILGFLDDDCIPAPNWLEAGKRAVARHRDSDIWVGQVVMSDDPPPATDLEDETTHRHTARGRSDPWNVGPSGGNCFIRRSVFEGDVGFFDPLLGQGSLFPGAEDGDLVYRTLRSGRAVTRTCDILIHHLLWRDETENIRNSYRYGLGVGAFFAKAFLRLDPYPMTVVFARRWLIKAFSGPAYLLMGRIGRARNSAAWLWGIARGFWGWVFLPLKEVVVPRYPPAPEPEPEPEPEPSLLAEHATAD